MPSVTSQYSDGSHELRSASPAAPEPLPTTTAAKYATTAYQTVPTRVGAVSALYGSDGSSSRHSLDRLSASRDPRRRCLNVAKVLLRRPRDVSTATSPNTSSNNSNRSVMTSRSRPGWGHHCATTMLSGWAVLLHYPSRLLSRRRVCRWTCPRKRNRTQSSGTKSFNRFFSHLSYFSSFVLVCWPSFKFVL